MTRKPRHPPGPSPRKRQNRYHHGDLPSAAVDVALAALDAGRPLPPLRRVAAECGVAHPSLYRHFENLEALRLTVAAACFRDYSRQIRAAVAPEQEPIAGLRAGCEASTRWGLAHRTRYALMMGPELAGTQHHREFFAAAQEAFGTLVTAVAACGVTDPVPVAHTVMSAMHGLVDLLRKGRTIPLKAATVDEQIASMAQLVLEYVGARAQHPFSVRRSRPRSHVRLPRLRTMPDRRILR